jgi:exodeoxyribonuclease VII large subunit
VRAAFLEPYPVQIVGNTTHAEYWIPAEDLAAFNDEGVVRAVFACRVPVVTGVGHETDWTLVDLAADVRAPTPSAAAEICVPALIELVDRVAGQRERLARAMRHKIMAVGDPVAATTARLQRASPGSLARAARQRLANLTDRLSGAEARRLSDARGLLAGRADVLRAMAPHAVLARGYAALSDASTGAPIGRIAQTAPGRLIVAELVDGRAAARVERQEIAPQE